MDRRVVLGLGAILLMPLRQPAQAQQPTVLRRVGFLGPTDGPLLDEFRMRLEALGGAERRSVSIIARWPEGNRLDRLGELAAELTRLSVDVILAVGATAAQAAKGATTALPIVFVAVVDPVATGLVASLARPGGYVTGATSFDPQMAARQFGILRQAVPDISRVAILGDTGAAPAAFRGSEEAASAMGIRYLTLKADRAAPDFAAAFDTASRDGAQAVLVLSTPVTTPNRMRIAELAVRYRLPTLSPRDHADSGALICFGTSFSSVTLRAASLVDAILKGAEPGQLPIASVTQHELIVNLSTARQLGMTLPASVVSSANRVID